MKMYKIEPHENGGYAVYRSRFPTGWSWVGHKDTLAQAEMLVQCMVAIAKRPSYYYDANGVRIEE